VCIFLSINFYNSTHLSLYSIVIETICISFFAHLQIWVYMGRVFGVFTLWVVLVCAIMAEVEALQKTVDGLTKKLLNLEKLSDKPQQHVVITKERKLVKFCGWPVKDSDPDLSDWMEDAERGCSSVEDPQACVDFVMEGLGGQARDEVRVYPRHNRDTPGKIFHILQALYKSSESVAHLQQSFYQRDQWEGETLQKYSLALMKFVDRMLKKDKHSVGHRDVVLKERFIDGVRDAQLHRELRRYAMEHQSMSFDEFRSTVLLWTEDSATVAPRARANVNKQYSAPAAPVQSSEYSELVKIMQSQQRILERQQEQLNKLERSNSYQGKSLPSQKAPEQVLRGAPDHVPSGVDVRYGQVVCFTCGGRGHYARDCPSESRATGPKSGQQASGRGLNYQLPRP
jgi:hypothetical protein